MSAVTDVVREIFVRLRDLSDRVLDLESEHGEVAGFHFSDSFPTEAYPNQIVVRTDETPPAGGVMYRYNESTLSWVRMN